MSERRRQRPIGLMRRLTLILAGLALLLLVVLMAGAGAMHVVGPERMVQRLAALALDRPATIGRLSVTWDDPLTIEIRDIRLANRPGGADADMVRIGRLAALLDLGALLRGRLRYESMVIERAEIALERAADGTGNWEFGGGTPLPGPAVVPASRTQFPILFRATIRDSRITYASGTGVPLEIGLREVRIAADDEHAPATIEGVGRYNNVGLQMEARTGSLAALRAGGEPFPIAVGLSDLGGARVDFDGTLDEPLDMEGARGRLALHAPSIGALASQFGTDLKMDVDLAFEGGFTRNGSAWRLTDARGTFMEQPFTGFLFLDEGGRGQADSFSTDLDLRRLDVGELLTRLREAGRARGGEVDLTLNDNPTMPRVTGSLRVDRLLYEHVELREAAVRGHLSRGEGVLENGSARLAGGTLSLSAAARTVAAGTALTLDAHGRNLSLAALFALANMDVPPADGQVEARVNLHGTGRALEPILARLNGQMVATMNGGTIAASVVEQATTDLRALFRRRDERVPLQCVLAVLSLRGGQGELGPARLRTPAGEVHAAGSLDLTDNTMNLVVQGRRSGSLALDLPIRISGPLASPGTDLAAHGVPDPVLLPALPAALAKQVRTSPCRW